MKIRPVTPGNQIAILLLALFLIHAINVAGGMWLARYGVIPRTVVGLRGIVFSPLLHANWRHLMANATPLCVLLVLLAWSLKRRFTQIVAAIWVTTGLAVWVAGRPGAVQIGASGLIYGLASFLIVRALLDRKVASAPACVAVLFLYHGIVWGLLPTNRGVSWEGHLCGVAAGIAVARFSKH